MECAICGGTNFTAESGYFFCNECQTQTQELKEHAFQEEDIHVNIKSTKKIRDATPKKDSQQVTSWECWNIVIMMLTEELISTGVDRSIKKIVKCLWIRYLEKLEVINMQHDQKPKFSLVNMKKDMRITYGIPRKRKRKNSSSSEHTSVTTTSRRERSMKKRALAQAQYTEQTKQSNEDGGSSLHNETLTSLKTNSEKSEDDEEVNFNKWSNKELKRVMSSKQIKRHKKEIKSNTGRRGFKLSVGYSNGAQLITPVKIYNIIYLALLIKKDPMQLSDLLRFMREGHLSFNYYSHLFPESYRNKDLNITDFRVKCCLDQKQFRMRTAQLAKLLGVCEYIECPNLVEIGRRYCEELNLPDDIFEAVKNILVRNPPDLETVNNYIPNYEGRVMAIIMFVLKLFYGLDDATELNLSQFAKTLNATWPHLKMFDIMEWLEFIRFRRVVISEYHFPSFAAENNEDVTNADLYMQYRKSHNFNILDKSKKGSDMSGFRDLLTKIISLQNDDIPHIEYPPSLTPYKSHAEVVKSLLRRSDPHGVKYYMLSKYFQNQSMDFLLNPLAYLWELNRAPTLYKHGGLNDNWVIKNTEGVSMRQVSNAERKFVCVKVVKHNVERPKINKEVSTTSTRQKNIKTVFKEFSKYHKYKFNENFIELKSFAVKNIFNGEGRSKDDSKDKYEVHCFPYERHWINLANTGMHRVSPDSFKNYMKGFSSSFTLILREASRITEQHKVEMFDEFQRTEIYLIYCGKNYSGCKKRRKLFKLERFIKEIEKNW